MTDTAHRTGRNKQAPQRRLGAAAAPFSQRKRRTQAKIQRAAKLPDAMRAGRQERAILQKLRRICLSLPGVTETVTFGHPTFRVGKRTFAVLETYKGELSIAFKVALPHQFLFLRDPRFYRTPYVGQHGWVSLKTSGGIDWNEVRHLMTESLCLLAGRKAGAALKPQRRAAVRLAP